MDTYNADSGYSKLFTQYIAKPLSIANFKRYKSSNIARIAGDSIFQVLNFQKEAYGGKEFTVNVAIRPLYVPHEVLSLQPGNRLGYFSRGCDRWWNYKTPNRADMNFQEVNGILIEKVIPMFDVLSSSESLLNEYLNNEFPIELPSSDCWKKYDLAHINLQLGNYDESKELFLNAQKSFMEVGFEWALKVAKKCESTLLLFDKGNESLTEYLKVCVEESKKNLGLIDF